MPRMTALHILRSTISTVSAPANSSFRGSITHPTQPLCTLRVRRCRRLTQHSLPGGLLDLTYPKRERTTSSYASGVKAWHDQRAVIYERMIEEELGDEQCGAFLVWGDPSLYDSTLRIIDEIIARGTVEFEYEVVPGISSIQALAARHRIALNRIGESIHITTGRQLSEGLPNYIDNVVVLLDAECSFKNVSDNEFDIYWGAYIGTEDENSLVRQSERAHA